MEENEDEPEDVRKATPVDDEITRGEIDERSERPTAPVGSAKKKRHHCEKETKRKSKIVKNNKDCCRERLAKAARVPKTTTVLVYGKECILPKTKPIPRHCLTKKEWIDVLATPNPKCPPPCDRSAVTRKIRPVSARVEELAKPPKSRLLNTLQDRAGTLPTELVDQLIQRIEGETCLTPEQAERIFRDKENQAKKKRRRKYKNKRKDCCKEKQPADRSELECSSSANFDKEAVNCQYVMAENFVKSILEWKCPIPKEEFADIAQVILKRLSCVLEYEPVNTEDRKSQQMRFLADVVGSWVCGILFDVAEARREELEAECERRQREEEEESEEDSDEESIVDFYDDDDDDDKDDKEDKKRKEKKEKKEKKKGMDKREKKDRKDKKDDDDEDGKGGEPRVEKEIEKEEEEGGEGGMAEAASEKTLVGEGGEEAEGGEEVKEEVMAETKEREPEVTTEVQEEDEQAFHDARGESLFEEQKEISEERKDEEEKVEDDLKDKPEVEAEEIPPQEIIASDTPVVSTEVVEDTAETVDDRAAGDQKVDSDEPEKTLDDSQEEDSDKTLTPSPEPPTPELPEQYMEGVETPEKIEETPEMKAVSMLPSKRKPSKIPSKIALSRKRRYKTDTPFVTFDKIFHTIYNAVEASRENPGDDAITNRLHRAVFDKCSSVVLEESHQPLSELTKDVLDVMSGKIALWLRNLVTESQLNFTKKFPATVESVDVRDWTNWIEYVSETANTWSMWIRDTIRQAEDMRSATVTRGDWFDWTKSVEEDAVLWRRFYLESLHQAHQNLTRIRDREVVKTGTRILPDDNHETELNITNFEV